MKKRAQESVRVSSTSQEPSIDRQERERLKISEHNDAVLTRWILILGAGTGVLALISALR